MDDELETICHCCDQEKACVYDGEYWVCEDCRTKDCKKCGGQPKEFMAENIVTGEKKFGCPDCKPKEGIGWGEDVDLLYTEFVEK